MLRKTFAITVILVAIASLNVMPTLADETGEQDVRFEQQHFTVRRNHGDVYFDGVESKHPEQITLSI